MHRHEVDFTLAFRRLTELSDPDPGSDRPKVGDFFSFPGSFDGWLDRWRNRVAQQDTPSTEVAESMRAVNPAIIPRNHRVNAAIDDAVDDGDYQAFHTLCDVLADPFELPDDHRELLHPPEPDERVEATFCGT